MRILLNRLAWITCIGMFLVVIMGTLVTKTGSNEGCGTDWPLCNGKFIPDYTLSSMIEYSHRFVTGIEGLLVLAVFILVYKIFRQRDAFIYAASALFFTIVQAALGALAVIWPQSAPVLALHFGISLLAFVSTLLLALILQDTKLTVSKRLTDLGQRVVTQGFRRLVWFTWVYCYIVVYVGAFVRHTKSSGGCIGWPLCNGELVPEITGAQGIVFIHRIAALILFLFIAWIAYSVRNVQQGDLIRRASLWTFILVMLQVASGAFVTYSLGTGWYLTAGMIHALIMTCLYGALSYLAVLVRKK